jgi:hypothetical protein
MRNAGMLTTMTFIPKASFMDDISIYQTDSGALEVKLQKDTVWLRQEQMSQLFGRDRSVIGKHLRNIFAEEELEQNSVCAKYAHTAADGKTYQVEHFNLDVIISVGYRVKSPARHPLPPMGHPPAARTPHPRLHRQPPAAGKQRRRTGSRPATGAQGRPKRPNCSADTGRGLVDIVTRYAHTFLLLQRYDEGLLDRPANPARRRAAHPGASARKPCATQEPT